MFRITKKELFIWIMAVFVGMMFGKLFSDLFNRDTINTLNQTQSKAVEYGLKIDSIATIVIEENKRLNDSLNSKNVQLSKALGNDWKLTDKGLYMIDGDSIYVTIQEMQSLSDSLKQIRL